MNTFKDVSFTLKKSAGRAGVAVSSSHVHELIAAAHGYKSKAAMLATFDESVASVEFVIVDSKSCRSRARELGYGEEDAKTLAELVVDKLVWEQSLAPPRVAADSTYLEGKILEIIELQVFESEEVASAMAETNAYFDYIDLEVEGLGDWDTGWNSTNLSFAGQVSGEPDPDKVYSGHIINVSGSIEVLKTSPIGIAISDLDIYASRDDSFFE